MDKEKIENSTLVLTSKYQTDSPEKCPENEMIGRLYPGQVVKIYSYLCSSTSGNKTIVRIVRPYYIDVVPHGPLTDPTHKTYHATYS